MELLHHYMPCTQPGQVVAITGKVKADELTLLSDTPSRLAHRQTPQKVRSVPALTLAGGWQNSWKLKHGLVLTKYASAKQCIVSCPGLGVWEF